LFDVIIVVLAIFTYLHRKGALVMWVGTAFFFFALSYALTILGMSSSLILIPLRTLGYLSVIVGLILHRKK